MENKIEQESEQNNEPINDSSESNDKKIVEEHFNYRKAREDRIIRNTENRILRDLGVDSLETAKERIKDNIRLSKELEVERENGRKLSVYTAGFDDQFVDFVAHEVNKNLKENEKFEDALDKYKKKHSQFLRSTKIQVNSSPDFENKHKITSYHNIMNDFIRGKI